MPAPATTRIRLFHIVSKQKLELSNFRLLGDCTEWRMEVVAGEVLVAFERVVDDWTERGPAGERRRTATERVGADRDVGEVAAGFWAGF